MNKKVIALATILGISATSLIDILTGEAKDNLEFLKRYLDVNQEKLEDSSKVEISSKKFKFDYTIIGIHKETKKVINIVLGIPYDEYLENIEKTGYDRLSTDYQEFYLFPLTNLEEYLPDYEVKESYSSKELNEMANRLINQLETKKMIK